MGTDRDTRKLRAILSADVKSYSLLMADDEAHTIQTLKAYRQIMDNLIQNHSGRVVDNPGDNLLAEFSSAVNAVEAAVEIQNRLKKENAKFIEDKRLQFRIGVNIGDVVQDDDRIYGEGVNIAARIESLADAGGICISRNTYDHIKNKLEPDTEYLGEHEVKNIEEPVRVYKVLMGTDAPKPLVEEQLELPDKPSIAVLPFDNMSGDPDQEYFSNGLTEQIINGLCKVSNLFVIGRNSSFAYKGKSITTKQIAKELGVRYILEGSVQRAGGRVRITAQLIDAITDFHMWSETYDRDLEDIFALQDEITMKIITLMKVNLLDGDSARSWSNRTESLKAYTHALKSWDYFHKSDKDALVSAIREAESAIQIDPNFYTAYIVLAGAYIQSLWYAVGPERSSKLIMIQATLDKALALDNEDSDVYFGLGMLNFFKGRQNKVIAFFEKTIELNPNHAFAYQHYGMVLSYFDQAEKGLGMMQKGFRLDPKPSIISYLMRGEIYFDLKKYEYAIKDFKRVVHLQPDVISAHTGLIACYHCLGFHEKAADEVKEVLRIDPNFALDSEAGPDIENYDIEEEELMIALREAGLK